MIIIVFISCLLINLSYTLKTSDVCLINKSNRDACNHIYNYRCTPDYCTKDKITCKDFNDLKIYLKQIENTKANKKIELLIQSISECSQQQQKLKTLEKPCVCTDYGVKCDQNYCATYKHECDQLAKRLNTKCCKI